MVPTPLALDLAQPLRGLLDDARALLERRVAFDPAAAERTFTLAVTDHAGIVLVPEIMKRIAAAAPGIGLELRPFDKPRYEVALRRGEHDLAISVIPDASGIHRRRLFSESFASIAREGHPVTRDTTLESFCAFPHVVMSPEGGGPGVLDRALARSGHRRRVGLRVPGFAHGPPTVAASDLIMTLPGRLARHYARAYGLALFEPPVALKSFFLHEAWSARIDGDPAHRWFREQVQAAAAAIDGSGPT